MVNFGRDNDRTNCLLTTSYTSTKPSVSYGSYNGSILDPDVMCQRSLLTSNTYMCKSIPDVYLGPPKGDAVCSQIYCRVPSTMTCSGIFPSDGMPCDTRKRCVSGRCQPDYSAATQYLDSNCVWGNQKSLELPSISFVGNCATFLSLYKPLQCYTRIIQESCCASCKSYYTARAGCEYGDRSVDCVKYTREQVCPTYKDSLCCGYCAGYVGKRSVDGPVIAPTLNMTVPLGEKIHIKAEEYEDKLGRTH
ncbi:uncharacterized protein LOC131943559 isoform X1 [Physella acuta]|uniref:uncharacterized protein LOC131943559 isoform X1 n=1 Tax=Physella acuta TaxID=109671 RepID=UPI0027DB759C|nr:uncharacterized protein LOC131943559 isoform X1 [Physella acuta]